MNVKKKAAAILVAALCLVWSFGMAELAFADDLATVPGEIAAGTVADTSAGTAGATVESEPEPAHVDGWEQVGSAWAYWKNGEQVKGAWVTTADGPGIGGATAKKHRYWIAQDGTLAVNRLIRPSSENDSGAGIYAYATKRGYVATGKTVVGDKVYLAKATGELESGNSLGILATKKYDGKLRRYYIDPKLHAVVTGKAVKAKGFGWVYAYPKKGYLLTGLTKVDKNHVVLAESNGKLCNKAGWVSTSTFTGKDKQRYYLEPTKKSKTLYGARIGTFKVQGKRYLSDSKGCVFRNGYQLMNDKYYYADAKGALAYDGIVTRMYKKAQGYSSPSKYLLMVDIDDPKMIVFEGSKNQWRVKFVWDCCTGAPATPTLEGTFSVGIKGPSFGEDRGFSCYTYTQISGDYLFHTRIYYAGTHTLMDPDNLGNRHSHGCVHLLDENARWIQNNVPSGTTIACIR